MRSWLSKNRHVYWLLGLIALALAYFVTQHLGLQYHVVHLPLDDRIPFCPAFVVFYILWYFRHGFSRPFGCISKLSVL